MIWRISVSLPLTELRLAPSAIEPIFWTCGSPALVRGQSW
jgi:hypothetical protein